MHKGYCFADDFGTICHICYLHAGVCLLVSFLVTLAEDIAMSCTFHAEDIAMSSANVTKKLTNKQAQQGKAKLMS
eukprot:1152609-Pelagomonas_calceolata.AAC.2